MLSLSRALVVVMVVVGLVAGSFASPRGVALAKEKPYNPVIDPADFTDVIDNPFLPMPPGTTFHYETVTPDGLETDDVYISHDTKLIMGVTCVVVVDTVMLDGVLTELTLDWYAQDVDGNVWYFGEAAEQYDNGILVGTEGSWEGGVDGALPGTVMQGDPRPGHAYHQEFLLGVAQDMAQVVGRNAKVHVPYGSFRHCVQTKEWSPLEPGVVEHKYYAAGVGNVLVIERGGGTLRQVLVDITTE
jgi:hypothetical protein